MKKIIFIFLIAVFANPAFACRNFISATSKGQHPTLEDLYSYRVSVYEPNVMECNLKKTETKKLLVGIGKVGKRALKRTDGCSGPMEQGDKNNWEAACNVHDIMYSTLPPVSSTNNSSASDEWREFADRALMINMARICQDIWPEASPGLGGCFDGARNTYNWLRTLAGTSYTDDQEWAKKNPKGRISDKQYKAIQTYMEQNGVPAFGTSWKPDAKGVNIP